MNVTTYTATFTNLTPADLAELLTHAHKHGPRIETGQAEKAVSNLFCIQAEDGRLWTGPTWEDAVRKFEDSVCPDWEDCCIKRDSSIFPMEEGVSNSITWAFVTESGADVEISFWWKDA